MKNKTSVKNKMRMKNKTRVKNKTRIKNKTRKNASNKPRSRKSKPIFRKTVKRGGGACTSKNPDENKECVSTDNMTQAELEELEELEELDDFIEQTPEKTQADLEDLMEQTTRDNIAAADSFSLESKKNEFKKLKDIQNEFNKNKLAREQAFQARRQAFQAKNQARQAKKLARQAASTSI